MRDWEKMEVIKFLNNIFELRDYDYLLNTKMYGKHFYADSEKYNRNTLPSMKLTF